MNKQQRIDLLEKLGGYAASGNEAWQQAKEQACRENPWFIPLFVETAVKNIAGQFLTRQKLEGWLRQYNVPPVNQHSKTVGIVMAGNIPLVGFNDLLCTFMAGHKALVKPSGKDRVLLAHLVRQMTEWDEEVGGLIVFAENLRGCDAYIATGSNNSARYFDYYFGKYPNIIRRNRTSAAVLDGTETPEELELLADDIQLYFGLGCRNVTKLHVPQGYDFVPLLQVLKKYDWFADFHKYKHNYDYHLALLLMNGKYYMSNESVILTENSSPFSPVSQVHFEYYTNKAEAESLLLQNADIQCVVGHGHTAFGNAQTPTLADYADGVDTMAFLLALGS